LSGHLKLLANFVILLQHVRAYYDIASARFVDNITQSVRIGLFRKCCNGLRDVILRTLGILDSANGTSSFACESPL
jgi:hypothetical protein